MFYFCCAQNWSYDRAHIGILFKKKAAMLYQWETDDNFLKGEHSINDVPILSHYAPLGGATSYMFLPATWTYGKVVLSKKPAAGNIFTCRPKMVRTLKLEVTSAPEFRFSGFDGQTQQPILSPKHGIQGEPLTDDPAVTVIRLDSDVSFPMSFATPLPGDSPDKSSGRSSPSKAKSSPGAGGSRKGKARSSKSRGSPSLPTGRRSMATSPGGTTSKRKRSPKGRKSNTPSKRPNVDRSQPGLGSSASGQLTTTPPPRPPLPRFDPEETVDLITPDQSDNSAINTSGDSSVVEVISALDTTRDSPEDQDPGSSEVEVATDSTPSPNEEDDEQVPGPSIELPAATRKSKAKVEPEKQKPMVQIKTELLTPTKIKVERVSRDQVQGEQKTTTVRITPGPRVAQVNTEAVRPVRRTTPDLGARPKQRQPPIRVVVPPTRADIARQKHGIGYQMTPTERYAADLRMQHQANVYERQGTLGRPESIRHLQDIQRQRPKIIQVKGMMKVSAGMVHRESTRPAPVVNLSDSSSPEDADTTDSTRSTTLGEESEELEKKKATEEEPSTEDKPVDLGTLELPADPEEAGPSGIRAAISPAVSMTDAPLKEAIAKALLSSDDPSISARAADFYGPGAITRLGDTYRNVSTSDQEARRMAARQIVSLTENQASLTSKMLAATMSSDSEVDDTGFADDSMEQQEQMDQSVMTNDPAIIRAIPTGYAQQFQHESHGDGAPGLARQQVVPLDHGLGQQPQDYSIGLDDPRAQQGLDLTGADDSYFYIPQLPIRPPHDLQPQTPRTAHGQAFMDEAFTQPPSYQSGLTSQPGAVTDPRFFMQQPLMEQEHYDQAIYYRQDLQSDHPAPEKDQEGGDGEGGQEGQGGAQL